jgi:hypothetical protein
MRSFYSKDAFFVKMKKKPDQQQVFDNLDKYSEEDIRNLTGTHFPQWVKDALIRLKENNRATATSYDIAQKMNEYHKKKQEEVNK